MVIACERCGKWVDPPCPCGVKCPTCFAPVGGHCANKVATGRPHRLREMAMAASEREKMKAGT